MCCAPLSTLPHTSPHLSHLTGLPEGHVHQPGLLLRHVPAVPPPAEGIWRLCHSLQLLRCRRTDRHVVSKVWKYVDTCGCVDVRVGVGMLGGVWEEASMSVVGGANRHVVSKV